MVSCHGVFYLGKIARFIRELLNHSALFSIHSIRDATLKAEDLLTVNKRLLMWYFMRRPTQSETLHGGKPHSNPQRVGRQKHTGEVWGRKREKNRRTDKARAPDKNDENVKSLSATGRKQDERKRHCRQAGGREVEVVGGGEQRSSDRSKTEGEAEMMESSHQPGMVVVVSQVGPRFQLLSAQRRAFRRRACRLPGFEIEMSSFSVRAAKKPRLHIRGFRPHPRSQCI